MPKFFSYLPNCLCLASLLLCLTFSSATAAEGIRWSKDIERALDEAASSGKPVLMEFTADWCVYCKRMEKSTFADSGIVQRVNAEYVPLKVDADDNRDLVRQLEIKGLPAILIVSPDLTILERISGFQTAQALSTRLDRVSARPEPRSAPPQVRQSPATRPTPQPRHRTPAISVADTRTDDVPPTVSRPPVSRPPVSRPSGVSAVPAIVAAPPGPTAPAALPGRASLFTTPASEPEYVNLPSDTDSDLGADSDMAPAADSQSEPVGTATLSDLPGPPAADSAFQGICIVSAVDDQELVQGSSELQGTYRGRTLSFRSESCKARFLDNPERYWPMLDGACPVTLGEQNRRVEGDFQYAAVFRRRVWLFADDASMQRFLAAPADVVAAALDRL